MGCGSSSPSTASSTSVVPSSNIEKKESGTNIQLKEALDAVFKRDLVLKFGSKKAQQKLILSKINFLESIFPDMCVGVTVPPPQSKDFQEQGLVLFQQIDRQGINNVSAHDFSQWYVNYGDIVWSKGEENPMARVFFQSIRKLVRRQEDNIAKEWLKKRGGYTEEEVEMALTGLFKVYDANGDGVLDVVEFGNMMLEIMDARLDALGQRTKGIAHDRLSRKAAKAVIEMMDEDGNGTLDMNEFKQTLADSLKWNDERVKAAAERLSEGDQENTKLASHLIEFFQAMTWCIGKYIKRGGVKRAINLNRFFDSGPDPDAYWNQS